MPRDQVAGPSEERKERDRDRRLGDSQDVTGGHIAGTAAERTGQRQGHQRHKEIAADRNCERQEKECREDEAEETGLSKPDDPPCQQQRTDDRSGGTEKTPLLRGEERDAKT